MTRGIILIVIGAIVGLASIPLMVTGAFKFIDAIDGDAKQFLGPGQIEYSAPEPGRYHVWNDYRAFFDGRQYNPGESLPDGLEVKVTARGDAIPLTHGGSFSKTSGSNEAVSMGYFDLAAPQTVEVTIFGDFAPRVFSVSRFEFGEIFATIGGSILGFLALLAIGSGVAIWGLVIVIRVKTERNTAPPELPNSAA